MSPGPCLPEDIILMVLEFLLQDGCSMAVFATVSRTWQRFIERQTFSRIKLTPSRLADFGSMIHRNRSLVRYIWFCVELQEYDCTQCANEDIWQWRHWRVTDADNLLVTTAFQDLFSTLSAWEPDGSLLLDISVYSPSDSGHWFKYLTVEPDVSSDMCGRDQPVGHSMQARAIDNHHGWVAGRRPSIPRWPAIEKVFGEIMGGGLLASEGEEDEWWHRLPLVPAVTGVLLRQQIRRRWKPATLTHMFSRLPGLQEVHYEPWREWDNTPQMWTDHYLQLFFPSFTSHQLRRLVIFENFSQAYRASYLTYMSIHSDHVRIPSVYVTQRIAKASLTLEHLSASFIVDASHFFDARELSWKWPNLTWLALNSGLLVPQGSPMELDGMLRAAAAAAMKMPNLETMEIWNANDELAMLFRYQQAERWRSPVITLRGTWELILRPLVIQDWNSVALKHRGQGHVIVKELLDASVDFKSHGDAIYHLKLSRPVVHPVSLRQIRREHLIRGRVLYGNPTFPNRSWRFLSEHITETIAAIVAVITIAAIYIYRSVKIAAD